MNTYIVFHPKQGYSVIQAIDMKTAISRIPPGTYEHITRVHASDNVNALLTRYAEVTGWGIQ